MIRALETYRFSGEHYVVPYGYPPAQRIVPTARALMRAELGLPEQALALVWMGPMGPGSGLEEILTAMRRAGRPEQHLFLLGQRHSSDYVAGLEQLAEGEARFHFTGINKMIDAARYVKAADAIIDYPRPGELAATSAALSLGHGLPAVVPHTGYFEEVLGTAAIYFEADAPLERLTERLASMNSADIETTLRRLPSERHDKGHRQMAEDVALVYRDVLAGVREPE
jgi:hypothetical protein